MRGFLAVPADPGWVESGGRLVAALRRDLPGASWTRPESWHLTLRFLGEIAPAAAERFVRELAARSVGAPALELSKGGSVVFPPRGRPRVLGIGLAPSPGKLALEALAAQAEDAARASGLAPEERAFHPHVTLARLRAPWPAAAIQRFRREAEAWPFPAWTVRECVLFESRLDPAGAMHTPRARFELTSARQEVGA